MKIAEALMLRADMQKKLASLRERIGKNAVVQQGDEPHEDPNRLIEQAFAILGELETLVFQINRANLAAKLPDGRPLTEAIARRETLCARHSLLKATVEAAQRSPDRYGMAEIKWVPTVKVAALQKQSDDLAGKIRDLNVAIQETNWKHELE